MKIIELRAENIKRIQAVYLKPDGKSVVIGGQNGQGKSSILDSILFAIGGKDVICDKPIRKGEKRAEVIVDLGDLVITRRFTDGGTSLVVKDKNGEAQPSPQAVLDKLVGQLAFDPLEFSRLPEKPQRDCLARLAGLDFAAIDQEYQKLFTQRTEVNRLHVAIKANLVGKTITPGLPDEEIKADDLLAKLEEVQKNNQAVATTESNERQAKATALRLKGEREGQEAVVRQAEEALKLEKAELAEAQKREKEAAVIAEKAEANARALTRQDETPIKTEISGITSKNAAIRTNRLIAEKQKELRKVEDQAAALTKQLEKILDRKEKIVSSAKYPLEGLAVDEGTVIYNGIPLKQASDAEQIRISTAIGMALNPQLRVMLIRSGAFLDSTSLLELHRMAAEKDVQLWIERVGDGKEVSVVIEDGEVSENRMETPAAA